MSLKAITHPRPESAGGYSLANHYISVGTSSDPHVAKASAGQVYLLDITNNNQSSTIYVKFVDKATNPTAGGETLVAVVGVTAGLSRTVAFPHGLPFGTGISFFITTDPTDSGTTAVASGDVVVNVFGV